MQSQEDYRDRTSLIVTVDHGRGQTPEDWRHHGAQVEGAQNIWMAFVSPGSPLRGEWTNAEAVHQNQIAATLASFLGLDYSISNGSAGKAIDEAKGSATLSP